MPLVQRKPMIVDGENHHNITVACCRLQAYCCDYGYLVPFGCTSEPGPGFFSRCRQVSLLRTTAILLTMRHRKRVDEL